MAREATGVILLYLYHTVTSHPEFVVKFGNYLPKNGFFFSSYHNACLFVFKSSKKKTLKKKPHTWITYNEAIWNIVDF